MLRIFQKSLTTVKHVSEIPQTSLGHPVIRRSSHSSLKHLAHKPSLTLHKHCAHKTLTCAQTLCPCRGRALLRRRADRRRRRNRPARAETCRGREPAAERQSCS